MPLRVCTYQKPSTMQARRTLRAHFLILAILCLTCACTTLGKFNFEEHLSSKRRYPISTSYAKPIKVPRSCRLVQLHLYARHGTRYPSGNDIRKFDDLKQVFANATHTDGELDWLTLWQNPFEYKKKNLLANYGEKELYLFGRRTQDRYRSFWKNMTYDATVIEFASSAFSRSGQSGNAFAIGLFEGLGTLSRSHLQPVYLVTKPLGQDQELAVKWACPKWLVHYAKSKALNKQKAMFANSKFTAIANRISNDYGVHPPLKPIHAQYVHRACSFEMAFFERNNTWCSVLKPDDFLDIEYYNDMIAYYTYMYGHEFNTRMACKIITSLTQAVDQALGDTSTVKSALNFAHAETLFFIMSALGLYKDKYPLTADLPPRHINKRVYRTSNIGPFAANIFFEIYQCTTDNDVFVQMLVNEQPVTIPGCKHVYCPWNTFKQLVQKHVNCDFEEMCKINGKIYKLNFSNVDEIDDDHIHLLDFDYSEPQDSQYVLSSNLHM